jgi:hypothetical protein
MSSRPKTEPPPPPLPDDDGHIKLSFMDALFISRAPVRRLFFYEGPDVPPFPSLIRSLRSSLAAALAVFVPLAGKLTYRPSTDDVVVDCSAGGVEFCGGSIDDMRRLAVGDEHCTEALAQLGPELDVARLPCPLLAVQVTRPAVGGGDGRAVVVAVAIHHAVADGLSVWRFMRAWSAACRAWSGWQAAAGLESPTFDRSAVRYHRPEEAARKIAPALPVVTAFSRANRCDC